MICPLTPAARGDKAEFSLYSPRRAGVRGWEDA